ncbi:SubName: Full=Uncharacterized protein {ECO:0000313/EMBL:CCA68875.1} [Serendipita indica DSM 11827]|nr:SubName: Full=Uncharacterized protein {ECO:0000313/EMBL:CCA68875.1} [Serendipita indica DSM 11827]
MRRKTKPNKQTVRDTGTLIFSLPSELLIDIFRLACTDDRTRLARGHPQANIAISMTCSTFRAIILELPDAWTTIDFHLYWPLRVLVSYVTKVLKWCRDLPLNIIVRDGWRNMTAPWQDLASLFQRLFAKVSKVDTISFYISRYDFDPLPEQWTDCLPSPPRRLEIHHAVEFDTRPKQQRPSQAPKDETQPLRCSMMDSDYISLIEEIELVDTIIYLDYELQAPLPWKSFTQSRRAGQMCTSATMHGDYVFRMCPDIHTIVLQGGVFRHSLNNPRMPKTRYIPPVHTLEFHDHHGFASFMKKYPKIHFPQLVKLTLGTYDPLLLSQLLALHPTILDLSLGAVRGAEVWKAACPQVTKLSIPAAGLQVLRGSSSHGASAIVFPELMNLHMDCTDYSLCVDEFEELVETMIMEEGVPMSVRGDVEKRLLGLAAGMRSMR